MTNATRVTVIVPVADVGDELRAIVRPIDLQDLPYDRYQVVFIHDGSQDATGARLRALVDHRPNVAVVTATDRQSGWRQAADVANGDYVLLLGPRDRLHPWSLRALADHAAATGLDVVLGRSEGIGPAGFMPDALHHDWKADNADAGSALLAPVALIRRELFRESIGAGGWRATRVQLFTQGAAIGVLPDVPVAVGAGPADSESPVEAFQDADAAAEDLPEGPVRHTFVAAHLGALLRRLPGAELDQTADEIVSSVRRHSKSVDAGALPPALRGAIAALTGDNTADGSVDAGRTALGQAAEAFAAWSRLQVRPRDVSASWESGVLRIDADIEIGGDDSAPAGIGDVTLDILLRKQSSSATYRIPARADQPGDRPGAGNAPGPESAEAGPMIFSVSARIDPSKAAAGAPLQQGSWNTLVRVRGSGAEVPTTAVLPYVDGIGDALVDGLPIASFDQGGHLGLDVGATKHGIFGRCQPSDTSLSETAAGSLLTIRLPDLAFAGETRMPGHLHLGKFPLPATLCAAGGAARIECYVSGLAGSSSLAAVFPPISRQRLGLRLRIGPVGDMAVEADLPKSAAKKPANKAKKSATKRPAAAPFGGGVKSLLRPAFRRLPAPVRRRVRKAYRAITK